MTLAAVVGHFREEHRDFLTGFITLLISVVLSFVSGVYLGSVTDALILIPGLMMLVTPSINMRGAIAGILTSRLSSAMHLGTFEPKFGKDTELGDNIRSSLILTVVISAVLSIFGKLVAMATGTEVISMLEMIVITVISGAVAGLIVTAVGVGMSVLCYRRQWDLDMIGAPTVTTVGDMVTLPILVISALLIMQLPFLGKLILGAVVLVMIVISLVAFKRGTRTMKDVLKEGLPLLIPLSLLGIIAGLLYTNRLESLISAAAILILISPFMNGCGSIGGILTSRVGTEMHMGLVDPKIIPQKVVWGHFLENYIYALIILPIMAVLTHFAAVLFDIATPGLVPILLITLLAGIIVITVMNILGYLTAVVTYRIGFDPDNFGVPVVTSSIDLVGASALLLVMALIL